MVEAAVIYIYIYIYYCDLLYTGTIIYGTILLKQKKLLLLVFFVSREVPNSLNTEVSRKQLGEGGGNNR